MLCNKYCKLFFHTVRLQSFLVLKLLLTVVPGKDNNKRIKKYFAKNLIRYIIKSVISKTNNGLLCKHIRYEARELYGITEAESSVTPV